jgi:hypothetical protein
MSTHPAKAPASTTPAAARMPIAIGRSKWLPSLRRVPGARFAVILRRGHVSPVDSIAERVLCSASRTDFAGSPTIVNTGWIDPLREREASPRTMLEARLGSLLKSRSSKSCGARRLD